jgi:hypothetical protein
MFSRTRVVVADRGEARFYDYESDNSLTVVGRITDPKSRLHNRDFNSDRPGRVFDHAAKSGARRGAVAHHGTGSESTPLKLQAKKFAESICREIEDADQSRSFEQLVIMAEPSFLGLIREAMPKRLMDKVVLQVHKDLVHSDDGTILNHIYKHDLYDVSLKH